MLQNDLVFIKQLVAGDHSQCEAVSRERHNEVTVLGKKWPTFAGIPLVVKYLQIFIPSFVTQILKLHLFVLRWLRILEY